MLTLQCLEEKSEKQVRQLVTDDEEGGDEEEQDEEPKEAMVITIFYLSYK